MGYSINHILICSDGYPTKDDPVYTFVEQIVNAFAALGVCVSVVAPQSVTKCLLRKVSLHPLHRIIQNSNGTTIEVFQPYTITLGKRFYRFNYFFRKISLWMILRKIKNKPQVCYGHFWHCAIHLYRYAKKNHIPLFVASGEASIEAETNVPKKEIEKFLDYYSGVFFASSKNKKESFLLGFLRNHKNIVLPNAIDSTKFFKKNKISLRDKYGISQDFFIVAFVGAFIDRKGPQRVADALKQIDNSNIKAFFIGSEKDGALCPFDYDGIIFKGSLSHEKIVDYLNMADIFVLPTLAEGCCNAIIEAMACGLPIVSSNRAFNDDILSDSYSIRINPESINEIANAIKKLYVDSELGKKMGAAALDKTSIMTVEKRAATILDFMNKCLIEIEKC